MYAFAFAVASASTSTSASASASFSLLLLRMIMLMLPRDTNFKNFIMFYQASFTSIFNSHVKTSFI